MTRDPGTDMHPSTASTPRSRRTGRDTLVTEIPGGVCAAPTARRLLAAFQPQMSRDALHDARLVVTELVNNCVEHGGAGPESVVRLVIQLHDGILEGEVIDAGPGFDPPASLSFDDTDATSGRGLRIVAALTDRWGVAIGDGTHVWFEMPATRTH